MTEAHNPDCECPRCLWMPRIAALETRLKAALADKEYAIRMYDQKEATCLQALARIAVLEGLLREALSTLEMWRDVAPAYSLCSTIRAALGEKP